MTASFQYRYATAGDILLIILAILGSLVNGVGFPLMSILFGGLTNSFIGAEKSIGSSGAPNATPASTGNLTPATFATLPPPSPDHTGQSNGNGTSPLLALDEFNQNVISYAIYYSIMGVAILVSAYAQVRFR